jgi:protein TonB
MFEQTLLIDHPGKRSWTLAASLTAQCTAVAVALAIPLLFTQKLPLLQWERITLPHAPLPLHDAVPTREVTRTSNVPATLRPVFTAPANTSHRIDTSPDPEPAAFIQSISDVGVIGGGDRVGLSGLFDNLSKRSVVKPPPEPVKPVENHSGPVRVSSGVQAAKLIKQVIPVYPEIAKRAGISGVVRLSGIIGKDGTIQNLQVVSGHPLLVRAALDAVRQWIYKPTLLSGEAVEVMAPIDVNFIISR